MANTSDLDNLSTLSDSEKIDAILKNVVSIRKNVANVEHDVIKINSRLDPVEHSVTYLQKEVEVMQASILHLNRSARAPNLIVYGIPDDESSNSQLGDTITQLFEKVNSAFDNKQIIEVSRMGARPGKRPVKIIFANRLHKSGMFRFTDELRKMNISISDDYSPEERSVRRALLNFFPVLKNLGMKPKIRGDKVLIDGKLYTLKDLQDCSSRASTTPPT